LKTVFALTAKVRTFNGLLGWVNNQNISFKKTHAVLITLFCNIILKQLNSVTYDFRFYLNLSYSTVLHDLNLSDYLIKNEFRILNAHQIKSHINRSEQQDLINHVNQLMPTITNWAHCPTQVLKIIQNHHERPNGNGFPLGLKSTDLDLDSVHF
jgi:HD-GYP domain-containing protein (c-di-GMP phosphodiesterase class II)